MRTKDDAPEYVKRWERNVWKLVVLVVVVGVGLAFIQDVVGTELAGLMGLAFLVIWTVYFWKASRPAFAYYREYRKRLDARNKGEGAHA